MKSEIDSLDDVVRARESLDRLIQQRQQKVKLLHGEPFKVKQSWKAPVPNESYKNTLEFSRHAAGGDTTSSHDQLMRQRRDDFEKQRDANAARLREYNAMRNYLLTERQRIMAIRDKVVERPISSLYEDEGKKDRVTDEWECIRLRPDPNIIRQKWQTDEGKPTKDIIRHVKSEIPEAQQNYDEKQKAHRKRMNMMILPYDGSLGLSSYEPWQLSHYEVCRQIIEDEMTRVLERLFPLNPEDPDMVRGTIESQMESLAREKAIKLIYEEIFLEVTLEECHATAVEYNYLMTLADNMANNTCIKESEVRASMNPLGRAEDDPIHREVQKKFYSLQSIRNTDNSTVWKHTQFLHLRNPTAVELRKQMEDTDATIIDYSDIPPIQLKSIEPMENDDLSKRKEWIIKKNYWREEILYWSKYTLTASKFQLPKQCKSITAVSLSPLQNLIAIGTVNGVLLVYRLIGIDAKKFTIYRASPASLVANESKKVDDPIVHISWSIDSSHIASVSKLGQLNVWHMSGEIGNKKTLGPILGNQSNYPIVLSKLFQANKDRQDFVIGKGPLRNKQALKDREWGPKFAVFLPTISLLGSCSGLCVGMTNNDLLLMDPVDDKDEVIPNDEEEDPNIPSQNYESPLKVNYAMMTGSDVPIHQLVKNDIPVSLFRMHKHPIVFVTFLDVLGDLITMDDQGYLMVWRYSPSLIAKESHWFKPKYKMRVNMYVTLFEPNVNEEPHICYDFELSESERELNALRQKNEKVIDDAGFRNPLYKIKNKPNDFVTFVYRNTDEALTESGAILHEVTRSISDGTLLVYQTRVYKPYPHFADFLVGCALNKAECKLVCLVLYPPDPPDRGPWIEVVSIDLRDLVACDPRIQIGLMDEEYAAIREQNTIYFDVSQPITPFGATYLIINMLGRVQMYSMVTGKRVIKTETKKMSKKKQKKPFTGLQFLDSKLIQSTDAEIMVTNADNGMLMLSFTKGSNFINVLALTDNNTAEERNEMLQRSHQIQELPEYSTFHTTGVENAFYMDVPGHPEALIRSMLYECMESALQDVNGSYLLTTLNAYTSIDRQQAYKDVKLLKVRFNAGPDSSENGENEEVKNNADDPGEDDTNQIS